MLYNFFQTACSFITLTLSVTVLFSDMNSLFLPFVLLLAAYAKHLKIKGLRWRTTLEKYIETRQHSSNKLQNILYFLKEIKSSGKHGHKYKYVTKISGLITRQLNHSLVTPPCGIPCIFPVQVKMTQTYFPFKKIIDWTFCSNLEKWVNLVVWPIWTENFSRNKTVDFLGVFMKRKLRLSRNLQLCTLVCVTCPCRLLTPIQYKYKMCF